MPRKDAAELAALRDRLGDARGQRYWRGLEELAKTDEFRQYLEREFPAQADEWTDPVGRRQFLKLMGASLALAGLTGCPRQPEERIVPYVRQPELLVPGKPLFYATAITLEGYATGLLVESHMGRPTKVEGNPLHPASPHTGGTDDHSQVGATDAFAQASVLNLYDPDRSQVILRGGHISSWRRFLQELTGRLEAMQTRQGQGLRILTETITSPTVAQQLREIQDRFPHQARWHQYEPLSPDNTRQGMRQAFGENGNGARPHYHFDRADVVLSLDADFLGWGPARLKSARDFMDRRRVSDREHTEMNRLYVVEPTPTITGTRADHRLPLRFRQVAAFARALAGRLGVETDQADGNHLPDELDVWLNAVVDDLQQAQGASLVIAGEPQPPEVHALVHAINEQLGNVGETVEYIEPAEAEPVNQTESLRELVEAMRNGEVELLLILGGNPVFTAPVDFRFGEALEQIPFSVHLSGEEDETSALCQWHIPESHYLETWGDARAFDGTATIMQPLIAPLFGTRSMSEILSIVQGQPGRTPHQIVRDFWQRLFNDNQRVNNEQRDNGEPGNQQQDVPPEERDDSEAAEREAEFDRFWRRALHDGIVQDTQVQTVNLSPNNNGPRATDNGQDPTDNGQRTTDQFDLLFRPDPSIWDGRFANNGWLQELPRPISKLTWDNAALIAPQTAERLGLEPGDMVEIGWQGGRMELPFWPLPGQPQQTITINLGFGRTHSGRVGTGAGFNAYRLRTSRNRWFAPGATLRATGERYPLATTHLHHLVFEHRLVEFVEDRHIVRSGTADEYREYLENSDHAEKPAFMLTGHEPPADVSFYPDYPYTGYKWGMAIDQTACIGCNACVVACQAENNIPVVGKDQVLNHREMHWLRIDHYYEGGQENPQPHLQPMLCVHCEKAPCEVVCPVAATTHSNEGLNEMTYNRCVGTRYCSNNCPYKVRRFNFFDYAWNHIRGSETMQMLQNPDVTVRSRGVMEKCTFCVQRINQARIQAEREDRRIQDGELVTACQASCPTQAIVFGDLNDPNSEVRRLQAQPINYGVLEDLNTRPRATHLASMRNPHPDLLAWETQRWGRHTRKYDHE